MKDWPFAKAKSTVFFFYLKRKSVQVLKFYNKPVQLGLIHNSGIIFSGLSLVVVTVGGVLQTVQETSSGHNVPHPLYCSQLSFFPFFLLL